MSADPEAAGFGELLQGDGQPFLRALAWIGALGIIFVIACMCFWVLSWALP